VTFSSHPLRCFADLFGDGKILIVLNGDEKPFVCTPVMLLQSINYPMHISYAGCFNGDDVWEITKDEQNIESYLLETGTIRRPRIEDIFEDVPDNEEARLAISEFVEKRLVIDDKGWISIRLALG
jgi:hypothetical protein